MKTFLKVLLIAALLIVAIKLSPVILIGALLGLFAAALLGAVGLSLVAALVAVLLAVLLAFTLALSPIWIPVLVVMGLVSLFRKNSNPAPAPVATA